VQNVKWDGEETEEIVLRLRSQNFRVDTPQLLSLGRVTDGSKGFLISCLVNRPDCNSFGIICDQSFFYYTYRKKNTMIYINNILRKDDSQTGD